MVNIFPKEAKVGLIGHSKRNICGDDEYTVTSFIFCNSKVTDLFYLPFNRELNNQIMEAEACHSLGVAQHALGDHAAAVRHHRAELELAHRLGLTHLQVRSTNRAPPCITKTIIITAKI